MKKEIALFSFVLLAFTSFCLSASKNYFQFSEREIVDADFGISFYEKYSIGGDSIRKNEIGKPCQNWVEDYYTTGQLLHSGYYIDGRLVKYKNYYTNKQVERDFKVINLNKYSLKVYYTNGNIKTDVIYVNGASQKWIDYYENGQIEFVEEYNKAVDYLIRRNSFYANGNIESSFELIDKKKKKYIHKDFFENGLIKEEVEMALSSASFDYVKNGYRKEYTEKGGLFAQEYYVEGVKSVDEKKQLDCFAHNEIDKLEIKEVMDTILSSILSLIPKDIICDSNSITNEIAFNKIEYNELSLLHYQDQSLSASISPVVFANTGLLPERFQLVDFNHNNSLSILEINSAIDQFFNDETTITSALINEMIDYFFEE